MKIYLPTVTAVLLIGSATSALCQPLDNTPQTAQQWRQKVVSSTCITYDPNDWQSYPLNFQDANSVHQAQPGGIDRLRPRC
ncbi:hypothetical protein [Paraburkholderia susongensis]|uniref:Secreted protein n=1 Tax=Paraburkholderia susongensis TaxID=1515439 RepID=A0A1X7LW53_9BURK|nr:hypothetical protein [Paraburkholderia susongensis]SMG58075.1 hypothetical protein SAMN06265784_110194 [Paraburkholderia susongensis]